MKELHLVIVSPERRLFDGTVLQAKLPGEAGEFQVLPGHAPLISSLVAGTVTYTVPPDETRSLQIAGGFAEINNNQLSVCAEL